MVSRQLLVNQILTQSVSSAALDCFLILIQFTGRGSGHI